MDMDGDKQFSRDDLANLDKGDHVSIDGTVEALR